MVRPVLTLGLLVTFSTCLAPSSYAGGKVAQARCDHAHGNSDALCFNLTEGWFDPWEHAHFRNGTPLVHHFGMEPAFLGRDAFVDYSYSSLDEGKEHEIGLELEWALTRRIGVVFEQGYAFHNPDRGPDADGWGDLAIVPRFVVADCDRCIISANLEIVAPTGSADVGAGEEWRLAPFITTWCDLGNWWSLSTQTGFEFAMDSNETEFFFAAGIAKSIRVFDAPGATNAHGHVHELPTGILSLIGEVSGAAVVDGDPKAEGVFELNGLVGVSVGITEGFDLRGGYRFPLNSHSELKGGITVGAIYHF